MAKHASEYKISHKELAAILVREFGIDSGLWTVGVHFTMAGAIAGPSDDAMLPAAIVGVQSVGLTRAEAPGPLTFDAAELRAETD